MSLQHFRIIAALLDASQRTYCSQSSTCWIVHWVYQRAEFSLLLVLIPTWSNFASGEVMLFLWVALFLLSSGENIAGANENSAVPVYTTKCTTHVPGDGWWCNVLFLPMYNLHHLSNAKWCNLILIPAYGQARNVGLPINDWDFHANENFPWLVLTDDISIHWQELIRISCTICIWRMVHILEQASCIL